MAKATRAAAPRTNWEPMVRYEAPPVKMGDVVAGVLVALAEVVGVTGTVVKVTGGAVTLFWI